MSYAWVLVADSSSAKIFKAQGSQDTLHEVASLVHTESRIHEREISSDFRNSHAGQGRSRHNFEGKTGIKEYEAVGFSREINAELESGLNSDKFTRLIVVAPPAFLGVLRKNISAKISSLITEEINKDLVKFSPSEIMDHLPAKI